MRSRCPVPAAASLVWAVLAAVCTQTLADPVLENGWDNGFFAPFTSSNAATVIYGDSGWLGGPAALPVTVSQIDMGLVVFDSPTAGSTDITVTFNDGDPSGLVFGPGTELYRTTFSGVSLPATEPGESSGFTLSVPLPSIVTSGGYNNVGWSVRLGNYDYAGSFGFQVSTFSNFTTGFPTNNASYFDGSTWSLFSFGPDQETQSVNFVATITAVPEPIVFEVTSGERSQGSFGRPVLNSASSVTKTGAGTLSFDGLNHYAGPTLINEGTLALVYDQSGSVIGSVEGSAEIRVAAGATFDVTVPSFFTSVQSFFLADGQMLSGGGGVLGSITAAAGSTVSPGSGVGALTVSDGMNWFGGGGYDWQIRDAAGTAGQENGWDLLTVGGLLTITATAEDPFGLNLWSLSAADTDGPAAGFDPTVAAEWTVVTTGAGIVGFAADAFRIMTDPAGGTGGFANDLRGGAFSIAQEGNDLKLVFTPGPPTSDIVINVPIGSQTQGQAGYATIPTADSVTKIGAGTLVMDAANGYAGPTTISAGTLEVANADGLASSNVTVDTAATLAIAPGTVMKAPAVILDGGTLAATAVVVNATTGIGSLAVNAGTLAGGPAVSVGSGGELALAQDARVTVAVGSLVVAEAAGGGRVDVGAGQVSVAAGGITAADLRADLLAGRNGGGWSGMTGITSSTAAAAGGTRAVGYLVAGDGSAIISFAAPGDTNLNGQVDVFDLVSINSSGAYGTGATSVWARGDFNYDGVTNVFDLVSINGAGAYGQGNYFPASPSAAGGAVAVPEPALPLLLTVVAGLAAACRPRPRRWAGLVR
jgi:autotransporter-associated beta strand protein